MSMRVAASGLCLVVPLLAAAPAWADNFGDCEPVGTLDNFEATDPPVLRSYGALDFRVFTNGTASTVTKEGKTCGQTYRLKQGAPASSDLEIMKNYAEGLPSLGLHVTNTNRQDDEEVFATGTVNGVETWVHVWPSNGNTASVQVLQVQNFKAALAPLTGQDCAPVPGLLNYTAAGAPVTHVYDRMDFRVLQNGADKVLTKSGASCGQTYSQNDGATHSTDLEIMRNYAQALPAAGLSITNTKRADDEEIFATGTINGTETWAHVWPSNGSSAAVRVLSVAPFKPTLAPVGPKDCPPVPGLVNFSASADPQTRGYDALDFRVVDKGSASTVTKKGAVCTQSYALNDGVARKTDLEIIKNFAQALPAQGFTITNGNRADDEEIFATRTKDGVESWVHVWPSNGADFSVQVLTIAPFHSTLHAAHAAVAPPPAAPKRVDITMALAAPAGSPEKVRPDIGDFPYLTPVPGSVLVSGRLDPSPFYARPADARQPEMVANSSIVKEYRSPPGAGLMPVVNAYKAALLQSGWSIVNETQDDGVRLTAHYGANNRNLWAGLHFTDAAYTITVADATIVQSQLAADLQSQCHLRLTGVLFDFDKSSLKPESDPVLQQVHALLANDPGLRLEIQGHTDNVGSETYNQRLSQARARAVVSWLVHSQVAGNRLTARGYGKTRPVASNDTDAGRAQNRRVEIANPACR
jgi:outer membrane protein OmpA-like peptidoglycan-associated protein